YREKTYVPGEADYAFYLEERAAILHVRSIARAALMKGGILWRLTLQMLGIQAAVDVILQGPDDYMHGMLFQGPNMPPFWDDELSESSADYICGVYRQFTGMTSQMADRSWWPKAHAAWRTSGLNVGIWSYGAEKWYQQRLQRI
ncbi:hypothetical protein OE88DRAFT_1609706, partial [Heliocybe sulcata]